MQTQHMGLISMDPPDPGEIVVEDVARALSQICRFGGHSRRFYSVAQHCCFVHDYLKTQSWISGDPQKARDVPMLGLLHDAHEAYVGDMIAPLKWVSRALGEAFEAQESAWYEATLQALDRYSFELAPTLKDARYRVGYADLVALATERRDLFVEPEEWGTLPEPVKQRIKPWSPRRARHEFLWRYYELRGDLQRAEKHSVYAVMSRFWPWG